MRILAIADIHGATDVYEWLRDVSGEYAADLVILAGDLLIGGWKKEQTEQACGFLIPLLDTILSPVCYIMGNDDSVDLAALDEKSRSVHGRRLQFGCYNVAGYQYSPPFVGGCHEKQEEEIDADLRRMESLIDESTILVTHTPAYGHADRLYSGYHVGSRSLSELIDRTNVLCHIHGHIHHSFGRVGNHFNVAAGARQRAMLLDLPSLTHRVIEK